MTPMGAKTTAIGIVFGLALSMPAGAQPATAWACTLSDDLVRLHCAADETAAPQAPTATVNGTPFPLDPRRR